MKKHLSHCLNVITLRDVTLRSMKQKVDFSAFDPLVQEPDETIIFVGLDSDISLHYIASITQFL